MLTEQCKTPSRLHHELVSKFVMFSGGIALFPASYRHEEWQYVSQSGITQPSLAAGFAVLYDCDTTLRSLVFVGKSDALGVDAFGVPSGWWVRHVGCGGGLLQVLLNNEPTNAFFIPLEGIRGKLLKAGSERDEYTFHSATIDALRATMGRYE